MPVNGTFRAAYRELEARMRMLAEQDKAIAEQDKAIFLPNCEPDGQVDYVLICMEPSLGRWAGRGDPEQRKECARSRISDGFRNFLPSDDVAILHFAIRRYLCGPGERYHITDISKGAMLVKEAERERERRYQDWFPLLQEEIDLIAAPHAGIVAVGSKVECCLTDLRFQRPFVPIIHYSPLAQRARKAGIVGHEAEFEAFRDAVCHEDLVATADEALKCMNVRPEIQNQTIERLRKFKLTESGKMLIFNYKLKFESQAAKRQGCRMFGARSGMSPGTADSSLPRPPI